MKTFYHITYYKNIDSIKHKGLIPAIGENSIDCKELEPTIYLFNNKDDVENAMLNWVSELFSDEPIMVCVIQVSNDFPIYNNNHACYEWITHNPIPVHNIVQYIHEDEYC